jgi:hypothetical protein
MHARRDHRAVERREHFLSARARHRRGHGAAMLIHAFAGEIIERIQCEPARE